MNKQVKEYPIFQQYDISDLARRTGYAEAYLVNVKIGTNTAGRRFKINCRLALGKSEAELFGEAEETA